jgi:hypothetical protein
LAVAAALHLLLLDLNLGLRLDLRLLAALPATLALRLLLRLGLRLRLLRSLLPLLARRALLAVGPLMMLAIAAAVPAIVLRRQRARRGRRDKQSDQCLAHRHHSINRPATIACPMR